MAPGNCALRDSPFRLYQDVGKGGGVESKAGSIAVMTETA